ncbi:MAG: 50S ribosomal protein L20 [Candidatus Woykebacteria bacterium RBG_13_40_7b]|uniref:Large ribosomal subunit protein bL20 n=1 Tax=Candidatus Woykebacteria bacterium RBG_13_40_7b TaxID=1802594 RepID=A0A1G1W9P1_9BACT|nr:MAG: 50S ribosomal protein L20 [Candidatus Woykebacteria bacterium RBG_13_40_7b]
MVRVKRGVVKRRKHKKVLKAASGHRGPRSKIYKSAKDSILHAGQYAYEGRKLKKRDFRTLWIVRIQAALKDSGLSYSQFIKNLKDSKIELDRKILAEIAYDDPKTFAEIVKRAKEKG